MPKSREQYDSSKEKPEDLEEKLELEAVKILKLDIKDAVVFLRNLERVREGVDADMPNRFDTYLPATAQKPELIDGYVILRNAADVEDIKKPLTLFHELFSKWPNLNTSYFIEHGIRNRIISESSQVFYKMYNENSPFIKVYTKEPEKFPVGLQVEMKDRSERRRLFEITGKFKEDYLREAREAKNDVDEDQLERKFYLEYLPSHGLNIDGISFNQDEKMFGENEYDATVFLYQKFNKMIDAVKSVCLDILVSALFAEERKNK